MVLPRQWFIFNPGYLQHCGIGPCVTTSLQSPRSYNFPGLLRLLSTRHRHGISLLAYWVEWDEVGLLCRVAFQTSCVLQYRSVQRPGSVSPNTRYLRITAHPKTTSATRKPLRRNVSRYHSLATRRVRVPGFIFPPREAERRYRAPGQHVPAPHRSKKRPIASHLSPRNPPLLHYVAVVASWKA